MRCCSVKDIVDEANRILFEELRCQEDPDAEYFFRGESLNFARKDEGVDLALGTAFPSYVDRDDAYRSGERELYQEALRLNIVSFEKDRTMVERIARMQHFHIPTRFCDMTTNVLMAAMFACGVGDVTNRNNRDNGHDGYIRILKVKKSRMKSFTSDIITAIAHLPLVNACNINPTKGSDGLDYLRYEVTNERPGFSMDVSDSKGELRKAKDQLCEEIQHVWAFKPIWNTERIRNQDGAFLAFGCGDGKAKLDATFSLADYDNPQAATYGIAQVDFIQINGQFKRSLIEELRYFGCAAESVYPDLPNTAIEISERMKAKGETK